MIGNIIAYLFIGLIGGAVAKAVMPGQQCGGWFSTALLGAGGALLAGFLGQLLFDVSFKGIVSIKGVIFAFLGALLILAFQGWRGKARQ